MTTIEEKDMETDGELLKRLQAVAKEHHDGHVTIMKFTTNWRVGFGTPCERADIDHMRVGETFGEAALAALENEAADREADRERLRRRFNERRDAQEDLNEAADREADRERLKRRTSDATRKRT